MRSRYRFIRIDRNTRPRVIRNFNGYQYTEQDVDAQTLYQIIKSHDRDATMITKWANWTYTYEVDEGVIVAIVLSIGACNYQVDKTKAD